MFPSKTAHQFSTFIDILSTQSVDSENNIFFSPVLKFISEFNALVGSITILFSSANVISHISLSE